MINKGANVLYVELQKNCGLEVGDKVRVVREACFGEFGWGNTWAEEMSHLIGGVYTVADIFRPMGIRLKGLRYLFPFYALQFISKPRVVTFDGKDIEISEDSYQSFKKSLL